ncbi:MAG: NAD(P)H-dependent oxidoreductase [Thermomicrobiales bacterium]
MDALEAPVRLLGIGGSSRATSITRNVLADVLEIAYGLGAEIDLASVHDLDLPVYNEDIDFADQPEALHTLLEKMKWANGFVIASPTYHSSIGGGIKNVLDALHILHGADNTYFDVRPVGLIAYGGPSSINSINALLHTTRGMRGLVVPTSLTVSRTQLDETRTTVTDEPTRNRATSLITEVLTLAKLQTAAKVDL